MKSNIYAAMLFCLMAAQWPATAQESKPPSGGLRYRLVNQTGRFADRECYWSLDHGRSWRSIQEEPNPLCPKGNGRLYLALGAIPVNFDDRETIWDFIEYAGDGQNSWHGNTTQVDAFCIPITIEMAGRKAGIEMPKSLIVNQFRKTAMAEFQNCLKGDWILSPCRSGFGNQGPYAHYFDDYINDVWAMYANERKTPSGLWIGKVEGQSLIFRPAGGTGETLVCTARPSTQDAFMGTGVLAQNPRFCAAINRHVLADPADWNRPEKYYAAAPFNFYSKFMHDMALNHKAYGFCYDDVADQSSFFSAIGTEVVVTLYWEAKKKHPEK